MPIYNLGKKNGCNELRLLNTQEIKKFETEISAVNAIWSPKTGIFDSHSFMKSLLDDFKKLGKNGLAADTVSVILYYCHTSSSICTLRTLVKV